MFFSDYIEKRDFAKIRLGLAALAACAFRSIATQVLPSSGTLPFWQPETEVPGGPLFFEAFSQKLRSIKFSKIP